MNRTRNVTRTTDLIKARGNRYRVEERWNQYSHTREDAFGIIDIIELDHKIGVIGIQVCGSDFVSHWNKLTINNAAATIDWLRTPGTKLFIYSWRKLKLKRGGKALRWAVKIREIKKEDIQ